MMDSRYVHYTHVKVKCNGEILSRDIATKEEAKQQQGDKEISLLSNMLGTQGRGED